MSTQQILVTGATGVIGRRVVPMLVAAGHRVSAIGRTPEKRLALGRAGAIGIAVDLFDPTAVRRAVEKMDVVVNLATHIPPSSRTFVPGAWRENNRIRREASANIVEGLIATGGGRRLIQESFAPIYEDGGDQWVDETAPVRAPRYNRGNIEAEAATRRLTQAGGSGVVLRFSYFYGADSPFTLDAIQFLRRGRAPVFGLPTAYLSSISQDDAATAVIAALGVPAGIYNVTDDTPLRRRDYVDALARAIGVAPPRFFPTWVATLAGSIGETLSRSHRMSNAKLRAVSGWAPRFPGVEEGWREMLKEMADRPRAAG